MNRIFYMLLMFLLLLPEGHSGGFGNINCDPARIEDLIFVKVNAERARAGHAPLKKMDKLAELARGHSKNMVENNFFSHVDKSGRNPSMRKDEYFPGLFGGVGENIAYNFGRNDDDVAARLVDQWMNSPGHRANILSKKYTHIGIGVYPKEEMYYATQVFGDLVAEMLDSVPASVSYGSTVTFRFRYLGDSSRDQVSVLVKFPDSQARYRTSGGLFYTGMAVLKPEWKDDIFIIKIECVYGSGRYMMNLGKGNAFYPGGIAFTVTR